MSTTAVALPESSDREAWSPEDAARVEAAGLVFTHTYGAQTGQRVLAPRPIVEKFFHTVRRTGLDPLARQIYCIPRLGRDGIEWSIQTAIDGFRVVAERSRQYAGQEPTEWLTEKGEWVDVFVKVLHGAHPLAARVTVRRHDWEIPLTAVATWDEYAQKKSNGDLTKMWVERGPGQLAKCAEALALRKAFPQDLSGVYTDEEMQASTFTDEGGEAPRRVARPLSTVATRMREAEGVTDTSTPESDAMPSQDATGPAVVGSVGEVELFACGRCGEPVVEDEGSICGPCEEAIEAEVAS